MMKHKLLTFFQGQKKEAERCKNVRFKKEPIFERKNHIGRKEGGIANEKRAKEADPGQDFNMEGDAKRRWKLAKNMLLAFKLEGEDNVGELGYDLFIKFVVYR